MSQRPIKFRAWDKVQGRIRPWSHLEEDAALLADVLLNVDRYIPMEFTGFKDKNSKEIYEGDIIRQNHVNALQGVLWTGTRISLYSLPDNDDYEDLYRIPQVELETIGNIYENPEFLNPYPDTFTSEKDEETREQI